MKIFTYWVRFYDISRSNEAVNVPGFIAGKDFEDATQSILGIYGRSAVEEVHLMITTDGDSGFLEMGEAMEQSNEWWQRMKQA